VEDYIKWSLSSCRAKLGTFLEFWFGVTVEDFEGEYKSWEEAARAYFE
jgi:uncharacterized protein YukE